MFKKTKKVLKGAYKTIKFAAVVAGIAKAGFWVYEKTKPKTTQTKTAEKPKTGKKEKKVKVS